MWESLIAVGAALAGSVLTHVVQLRGARVERLEIRGDAQRADALAAVTAYTAALADHRRAMWQFEDAKLTGKPAQVVAELEAVQHGTRSAITEPATRVKLLIPALAAEVREAEKATYAMRDSGDLDVLETRRALALAASDRFVAAAAVLFADLGVAVA
jgi:hypothetical protein